MAIEMNDTPETTVTGTGYLFGAAGPADPIPQPYTFNTVKAWFLLDFASTANGYGASLVGIEDVGGLITATTVEGALAENRAAIDAIEADYLTSSDIGSAVQAYDGDLASIAALTTTAAGLSTLTIADPGADRVLAWDDTAGAVAPIALADLTDEPSPSAGDYILIYGAEGDLRRVDWDDLPGGSAGAIQLDELSDVTLTALGDGEILLSSSGTFVNQTLAEADILTATAAAAAYQPLDSDLTTWAGLTPSANAQSLVTAADYAAMRGLLDLEAGTDFYSISAADAAFQPLDSDLTSIAALTTTAAGRSTLEIADPGADRILAWDDTAGAVTPIALADLTDEPAPASGDYFLVYGAEGDLRKVDWADLPAGGSLAIDDLTDVTITSLGDGELLTSSSGTFINQTLGELDLLTATVAAAAYQPLDSDLTTWAGLTPSANAQSLVTAADYAAMRTLLDLEAGTDFLSPSAIAAAYQPLDSAVVYDAAQSLTNGQKTQVYANIGIVDPISDVFHKADPWSVAFTKTGAGTISVKAGTTIGLNGLLYNYASDTAITMPTHSVGAYFIYQCNDGSLRSDASATAPTGFDTTTSRQIGGYYYGPGGLATAYNTGGDSTPQILAPTLWDLKFRPSVADPRGWSYTGSGWLTLWMLNDNWIANGVSYAGGTIADGSSPPKIPISKGGDGSATYSTLTQWEADEIYRSVGASLVSYAEMCDAAYGVVEGTSRGSDPATTQLDAPRTSKFIYQATGNLWTWCRDLNMRWDGTSTPWAWRNSAGGRGQLYLYGDINLVAALFGGVWDVGAYAGSRASHWYVYPWLSSATFGARGRCDHVCHI